MRARSVEMPWGWLRLWEAGEGATTVLAIHGLGGSGRYFDGLAEALGEGFRVVAPDLGGFGASSKPKVAADRAFHLEALETVARSAGAPTVVLGHSLGGVLGLLWAADRTDGIAGLAMVASPFPQTHPEWDPERWQGSRGALPRAIVATVRAGWPVLSLPVQVWGRYPAPVVRDYGRQSIRSRLWTLWSLSGEPSLQNEVGRAAGSLDAAGVPVLLAYAADDRSVSSENLEGWGRLLPGAERLVIAEGGHQSLLLHRFADVAPWVRGLGVGGHG